MIIFFPYVLIFEQNKILKYFFEIGYQGTAYHGWQIQHNAVSVQGIINDRLKKLLGDEIKTIGSGRTDTGVHAISQFFHVETQSKIDVKNVLFKMNTMLPDDIAIYDIRRVNDDASARFDAISRSYVYKISQVKNPFLKGFAYHFYRPLDIQVMNDAAKVLTGKHDFQAFSRVKTQVNHFICNVDKMIWSEKDNILLFQIRADRFLRGMVRAIVGTLLLAGENRIKPDQIKKILDSKDRREAGRAVPPEGLYLEKIIYPDHLFLDI